MVGPSPKSTVEMLSLTNFVVTSKTRLCVVPRTQVIKMTKGGCLCGKIVYEILGEPVKTVSLFLRAVTTADHGR